MREAATFLNDPRLHFGLGTESRMSEVEISWPSGKVEDLRDVPADFIYTMVEGQGMQAKFPAAAVVITSILLSAAPPVWACACQFFFPGIGYYAPAGGVPIWARAMAFTA